MVHGPVLGNVERVSRRRWRARLHAGRAPRARIDLADADDGTRTAAFFRLAAAGCAGPPECTANRESSGLATTAHGAGYLLARQVARAVAGHGSASPASTGHFSSTGRESRPLRGRARPRNLARDESHRSRRPP